MAEISPIRVADLREVSAQTGFDARLIAKDYQVTLLLYLLRAVPGLHFKGGTALQKTLLSYARLSEDIDFTVTMPISDVRASVETKVQESGFFAKITKDKDVEGFLRLVVHYDSPPDRRDTVFIDLNSRAKLLFQPQQRNVPHFYPGHIPAFNISTLDTREMIAEKVAAAIGRNQPRDHFDIYQIIKHKLPIDLTLVRKKCEASGEEFSIIRMFNNARKLKNRWDEDLLPLIREEVTFETVMRMLAKHFGLAKEKARLAKRHGRPSVRSA